MTTFNGLLQGYQRFRQSGWQTQRARWAELSEGQSPRVMVIACSDSRVEPSHIFDSRPGEIFVVRNVAALVPPFERAPGLHGVSAALEFAVQFLNVEEIVVLGHGLCGGCHAALHETMAGTEPGHGGFIASWIALLNGASASVRSTFDDVSSVQAERAMEMASVKVSLANLRTFPCIREKEASGELTIHGAWFAIHDGNLHVLDEATGAFNLAD